MPLRLAVRSLLALALGATGAVLAPREAAAQPAAGERGAAALAPLIDGLGVSVRVLMIGAHPDDEDNQLLALLARGRHARTAYLSLTRGDGGQNLIGNELGEPLGVIRTEELLAARRVDGAEQFFTRAFDFGFSKSAAETFEHWPREAVLGDVVRTVRAFRPHVIASVFTGTPRDGHGHHQVAGLLAGEVWSAAADTVRFPVGDFGRPWQPLKLYRGAYRFTTTNVDSVATLRLNAGQYDPILGRSYAEVAAESRSQHRSQGFGTLQPKGVRFTHLTRDSTRVGHADPRAERSIFDGVDTTFARLQALARARAARLPGDAPLVAAVDSLPALVAAVQRAYRPEDPSASVAPLAALANAAARGVALAGVRRNGVAPDGDLMTSLEELWRRTQQALLLAAGVAVEATASREVVAASTPADSSDTLRVAVAVYNRGRAPVTVERLVPSQLRIGNTVPDVRATILPDSAWQDSIPVVPTSITTQWWRRSGRPNDLFLEAPDGRSEEERSASVESGALRVGARLRIAGAEVVASAPVVQRFADPVRGEVQRPVAVVPGVTLRLDRSTQYVRAGRPLNRPIRVTLRSAYARPRRVSVELSLPTGLVGDSLRRTVTLPPNGQVELQFVLRGALLEGRHVMGALATVLPDSFSASPARYMDGSATIAYDHIPPQRLYFPAASRITSVPVELPPNAVVGYVAGVGDNVAPRLSELDLPVGLLDPATLDRADLSRYTTIVIGPRAYEANPALAANNARLLDWTRRGGTLVVQYGQYEMTQPGIMPYPIALGRPAARVTREDAPVTALDPRARVLTAPNRLTADDWRGWVQERSLYMPSTFDPAYRPILELHDPGEPENRGALLVAPYGRGTYVYTALALFRQLPAGHPGAARLFVNLIGARAQGARPQGTAARPAATR